MDLHVVGCHGGETPKHRPTAFVVDETLAIDAGSLTRALGLREQAKLEACLVSHAHLDHIRDLATVVDNRVQMGCPPLVVVGGKRTLAALRRHFFNNVLWPDFTAVPSPAQPGVILCPIGPHAPLEIAGYSVRAIPVSHTVECFGFIVERGGVALAYSGDTGPTDRLWQAIQDTPEVRALLVEVSFPDSESALAELSGHLTPRSARADLLKIPRIHEIACFAYHLKPHFQSTIERACARLRGVHLQVPRIDDRYRI